MGKCINHPDTDTGYLCMKYNIYLCDQCMECRDPDLFCKFRSSCSIHFISAKGFDKKMNLHPYCPGDASVSHGIETASEC